MAPEIDLSSIDDAAPDAPRQLREYAARKGEEAARVPELEKKVALLEAGIDISTPKGRAFMLTMEADPTDKDAVLAEATAFDPGIIKAAAPPASTTDGAPAGDGAPVNTEPQGTGSNERNALVDGAQPSGAATENIEQSSVKKAEAAIKQGATVADGIGSMIAERARAAQEGKISTLNRDGTKTVPVA